MPRQLKLVASKLVVMIMMISMFSAHALYDRRAAGGDIQNRNFNQNRKRNQAKIESNRRKLLESSSPSSREDDFAFWFPDSDFDNTNIRQANSKVVNDIANQPSSQAQSKLEDENLHSSSKSNMDVSLEAKATNSQIQKQSKRIITNRLAILIFIATLTLVGALLLFCAVSIAYFAVPQSPFVQVAHYDRGSSATTNTKNDYCLLPTQQDEEEHQANSANQQNSQKNCETTEVFRKILVPAGFTFCFAPHMFPKSKNGNDDKDLLGPLRATPTSAAITTKTRKTILLLVGSGTYCLSRQSSDGVVADNHPHNQPQL